MDDLYRENILEHYKQPRNWSPPQPELHDADLEFEDFNPLCGDELKVQLKVRICDIRAPQGAGCHPPWVRQPPIGLWTGPTLPRYGPRGSCRIALDEVWYRRLEAC